MMEWSDVHFLRPAWLLLLPLLACWLWFALRAAKTQLKVKTQISAHLLKHLLVTTSKRQSRLPIIVTGTICCLLVIALAGPSWDRAPISLLQDAAPLVIAVDLSATMDKTDIQPSRLLLARHKLAKLLTLRAGSRVALVAFNDTAHSVLPFTGDPALVEFFLFALATDLLPSSHRNVQPLDNLLHQLLEPETVAGTVLLVSDAGADTFSTIAANFSKTPHQLIQYQLYPGGVKPTANGNTANTNISVTVDEQDINALDKAIRNHLVAQQNLDPKWPWRDRGYWLTLPIWLLLLVGFRRGWPLFQVSIGLLLANILSPVPAYAESLQQPKTITDTFIQLWVTGDQLGRWHFDRGDYHSAAANFTDPFWRGVACYRLGNDDCAKKAFTQQPGPQSYVYLGNIAARQGQWSEAQANYDAALLLQPDWPLAKQNKEQLSGKIHRNAELLEQLQAAEPTLEADEIRFDEKGKLGKAGEISPGQLPVKETQLWLNRLQSSPAQFLKRKFSAQPLAEE